MDARTINTGSLLTIVYHWPNWLLFIHQKCWKNMHSEHVLQGTQASNVV